MAMIEAYFDESETVKEQQHSFVVAGYAADTYRWQRFEREWGHVLDDFGVPYMHMSEVANREGPFNEWDDERCAAFLSRLAFVITSKPGSIRSVSCAIPVKDYLEIATEAERNEVGHAYHLCLYWCIPSVLRLYAREPGHSIDFVFDDRRGVKPKALKALGVYKHSTLIPDGLKAMLGELSYADDKLVKPLQAADFLAYEVNKHYREPDRLRKSLLAINPVPGVHSLVTRDALLEVIEEARRELARISH